LDDDPALPELAFEDEGEGVGWSPLLFTGGAETFLPDDGLAAGVVVLEGGWSGGGMGSPILR